MTTAVTGFARQAVRIRFLGDFELTVNGAPVRHWRAGKARGLFQYLVIHRGQTLTRDRLYEALWPGSDPSAGGSSLKVAAHGLRRVLDAHPDSPRESGIRLHYRDFGYALDIAELWSDVDRFQELVHTGLRAAAAGDRTGAREQLRSAVELYAGEFLRGESADWVVEQREYLRSLALRALDVLRADAVGRDDFPDLIEICRRTLGIDRHHEETYRALMTAHGRRGEHACVRNWYELCARRLRDDLDVAPSRETDELLAAILPAPVAPAGGPPRRVRTMTPAPSRRTRPDPRAAARATPRGSVPVGWPRTRAATASDAWPVSRADARPGPRSRVRPEARPASGAGPRPVGQTGTRSAFPADARSGGRPVSQTQVPPGVRADSGPDARQDALLASRSRVPLRGRGDGRPEARPGGRTASRADQGAAPGTGRRVPPGGRVDARPGGRTASLGEATPGASPDASGVFRADARSAGPAGKPGDAATAAPGAGARGRIQ
ncbi:BTAD domain-containing putative transcriptional regulator [Streptomyces sp. NPDC015127]|uniref:BTAD domain-containing putative transcriptional regulator n=1 Tax=Streptomyces sp. NPDC015127 TaxID=3364939 RepID=UPI0036F59CDB